VINPEVNLGVQYAKIKKPGPRLMNKIEDTKAETKMWINWNCLMILHLLKLTQHQLKVVELFISFLKSPRSSKSEFGAKYYAENTKARYAENAAADTFDPELFISFPKCIVAASSPVLSVWSSQVHLVLTKNK
jgi:hypothetical protein